MKTIGIIGCGNMGAAILDGFASRLDKKNWRLAACNRSPQKLEKFQAQDIETTGDIAKIAANGDILAFAVKPYQMDDALKAAHAALRKDSIVISIAAGYSLARMRAMLGERGILCRAMPTTTAMAGRGIFAFCFEDAAREDIRQEIMDLFGLLGYCLSIPESKFTDFSALVGAGPAYVFSMMGALAQAGVTLGFGHEQSRKLMIELFAGCSALGAASSRHFAQLRDDVCSPAGLTISGVNHLDRAGLTGILVDAVLAARARGVEMES